MLMLLISIITITVPILLAVALCTLAERQVMGSMQRRFGPTNSGINGILQPIYDGLKLGIKEPLIPQSAAVGAFNIAPMIGFVLSQIGWAVIFINDASYQGLALMAISSLAVYSVMLAGWSSNSKYALLGSLRSVALMVSYELPMGACILNVALYLADSTGYKSINLSACNLQLALLPVLALYCITILAETKRIPFDLPEAEAELVAGYNVEYASLGFALFFISEYTSMLLMSTITTIYFLGGYSAILIVAIFYGFIWVRGTLPRYRYDQFMRIGFKALLPFILAVYAMNATIDVLFTI